MRKSISRKTILKEAGVLLAVSMMILSTIIVTANINDSKKANVNVSENMFNEDCGCSTSDGIQLIVGICDNFTLPTEPTYPSTALLHWILHHYNGTQGSRPCDQRGIDQYWAHTFDLTGACSQSCIKGATLTITVWNEGSNGNDALYLGCIDNNASNLDRGWNLASNGIPYGQKGTIVLNLANYPTIFHNMINHSFLDVIVEDDSAVDCAILTIECCCFNVSIPEKCNIGVQVTIKNICNETETNVPWNITITGGSLWYGQHKTNVISSFSPASTMKIRSLPIGFGKITITVTIDDCPPLKWSAFLLFIFVCNVHRIP
jgi:hypothetical protein